MPSVDSPEANSPAPEFLAERFTGSLLGGLTGDVIGAAVEAESPGYIRKTFKDVDAILALDTVPELITGEWLVGQFTDDTQMTLAVADWLLAGNNYDGKSLLEACVRLYEPWRHYGSGTRLVLDSFRSAGERWPALATAMFPQGSYGNGSAMRVGPVGLLFHNDPAAIIRISQTSSIVTHAHPLAIQGAALQATAVALAIRQVIDVPAFIRGLNQTLQHFANIGQDTIIYRKALSQIVLGLSKSVSPARMARVLGNGIKAQEAGPMAIYCFLAHRDSFEKAVSAAVFLGGDTDTIAAMTGTLAGAALGEKHIPTRWLDRVREGVYGPDRIRQLALALHRKGKPASFSAPRR